VNSILLVEDDRTFSRILQGFLKNKGHKVDVQHNVKEGIKAIARGTYHLFIFDYKLPDGIGIQLIEKAKNLHPEVPIIMMTGFTDIRTAVKAMRMGVFEYITKPVNPDELEVVLNEALKTNKKSKSFKDKLEIVKGKSEVAQQMHQYIELVGPTEISVILQGETGTGKEYVARAIHLASNRKNEPFVAVDCGVLSSELAASELFGHVMGAFTGAVADKKGTFEAAHKGTLFLDEIGNLGIEVQMKLLRALQERTIQPVGSTKSVNIDVRIISATNDDLLNSIENGDFREDLYHRLNEFKINVPALRNRGDDIYLFIDFFKEKANHELNRDVLSFDESVLEIFKNYDWPGNLRELKNVIRRSVLLTSGRNVDKSALPDEMSMVLPTSVNANGTDLKLLNEINEREMIIATLDKTGNNKSKTARLLNIDRKTLYNKMEKFGIK
jgi:two-component system, NtrC family, response regulator HydG